MHPSDIAVLQIGKEFVINTHNYIGVGQVAVLRQEGGESPRQLSLLLCCQARCKHLHILCCSQFN